MQTPCYKNHLFCLLCIKINPYFCKTKHSQDMKQKHLDVVCAVVRKDGKYFCAQRLRKGPDYVAEHWEFPGGKVKEGETREQALRREMKEELDWDIEVGKRLAQVVQTYPDFTITLTAFECRAQDDNFKLLAHIDSRWLLPHQLGQLEWTEADKHIIELLLQEEKKET